MKAKKELSTGLALLGFLLPLAVLLTLIFQGVSIMLGLTAAICVEGLFGVSVAQYLPFNLIALLSPVLAVVTAFIGFGVFKSNETVRFTLKCKKYDKQTGKPL